MIPKGYTNDSIHHLDDGSGKVNDDDDNDDVDNDDDSNEMITIYNFFSYMWLVELILILGSYRSRTFHMYNCLCLIKL